MNSYNPYFEAVVPVTENSQHNKKYSLRRRYQNPLREQLGQSKTLKYQNISLYDQKAERNNDYDLASREEQQLHNKMVEQVSNFNCMQSAQRILDFNQATSASIKNHTKTLSTTPSFENPFMHAQKTKDLRKSEDEAYNKKLLTKKSLVSSKEELHPSKTKSQKTAVSHKFSHHSSNNNERLQTENNSQPLSTVNCYGLYDDTSAELDRKGKISLKHRSKFNNQSRSELLICLKYSDLKEPIRSINPNHSQVPTKNSLPDLSSKPHEGQGLGKYICSSFKGGKDGCQCQPKCYWIDNWINLIADQEFQGADAAMGASEWDATLRQIEKDLPRTQPEHRTFRLPEYVGSLKEVLVCYAKHDAEVGYVQGMNFIAAALVYHSPSSFEALKVMEYIMKPCGFRKILLKDLAMSHLVSRRCMYELKRLSFDLYSHFVSEQVQLEIFITSWYFSMFGNFVPLESMHLVLDKFMRSQFTGLNEIILALLIYLKPALLALHDNHLMMAFSNQQLTLAAARIDWRDLVARSDHLLLDPLF